MALQTPSTNLPSESKVKDKASLPSPRVKPRPSPRRRNINSANSTTKSMKKPPSASKNHGEHGTDSSSSTDDTTIRTSPILIIEHTDLKPCLKVRRDVMTSDRHVSVNICHDTTIDTPRNIQRGRSSSLPAELLQDQLKQFNLKQSRRLPSLCEEGKLSVDDPLASASNPELRTRRVSFILPSESEESSNETNGKPPTIQQNFLTVPGGRSVSYGQGLPGGSDAFRLALLNDQNYCDDDDDDVRNDHSTTATTTDSDSDKSLPEPTLTPKPKSTRSRVSTPRRRQNNVTTNDKQRLLQKRGSRNSATKSRDISPRSPRVEWSKVSVIR